MPLNDADRPREKDLSIDDILSLILPLSSCLLLGLENMEDAQGEQGVLENCCDAYFVIKSIISMYPNAYAMASAVFPSYNMRQVHIGCHH